MSTDLEYAKANDVASNPDFQVVRFQLITAIKAHKAHQLVTSTRESGRSWNLVMEIMFNPTIGSLKAFKKTKKSIVL